MDKNIQPKTIDEYITTSPKSVHSSLKKIREIVHTAAPKAEETIKYRMPTFVLNGKNLVHFAVMKNHLGFYPTPGPIIAFKKPLAKLVTSKGAIQFPLDQPIPYSLIARMVKFRVKQLLQKIKP